MGRQGETSEGDQTGTAREVRRRIRCVVSRMREWSSVENAAEKVEMSCATGSHHGNILVTWARPFLVEGWR